MLATVFLPFIIGVSHCFDLDHLLAVATLNDTNNKNIKSLILRGATWGIGHAIPVLICGLVFIYFRLFFLRSVPFNLELLVGGLLVGIGVYKLVTYKKKYAPKIKKSHYLGVGIVHGLAGSAGVVLFQSTNESNLVLQMVYLLLFSFGAIIGMGGINIAIFGINTNLDRIKLLQIITPIISIIYGGIMIYNYV